MLFFVGIFFVFMSIIMLIRFMLNAARPKLDVTIKEIFMAKLKSDFIGIGPPQQHAKVSYQVNNQTYDAEVYVIKTIKAKAGDTIKITYNKSKPSDARLYAPKKELLPVIGMFLFGTIISIVSLFLSSLLSN